VKLSLLRAGHPKAGRGLFAGRAFSKGELITEYDGELISCSEAKTRKIQTHICKVSSHQMCIDAFNIRLDRGRGGASFANDPRNNEKYNCKFTAVHTTIGVPRSGHQDMDRVFLEATRNILAGEELYVSYGDDYWELNPLQ
jgi:uncharacterized protein